MYSYFLIFTNVYFLLKYPIQDIMLLSFVKPPETPPNYDNFPDYSWFQWSWQF